MYDIFMTTGVVDTAKSLFYRKGTRYEVARYDQEINTRLLSDNTPPGIHTYGVIRIGDLFQDGTTLLTMRQILDIMPLWLVEQTETDIAAKIIEQIPELLEKDDIQNCFVASDRMTSRDGELMVSKVCKKRYHDGRFRISGIKADDQSYFTSNSLWVVKATMPNSET